MSAAMVFLEPHYRIKEAAKVWNCSKEMVRLLIRDEPDVMRKVGPTGRTTYWIPESVLRRIHTKLTTPPKKKKK